MYEGIFKCQIVNSFHMPLISFYASWKRQKTSGFLMFLGGIEGDQWHEMSFYLLLKIISIKKLWKTEMYILWYLFFVVVGVVTC